MADIPIFPNGLDADAQPLKNLGAGVDPGDAVTLTQLNNAIAGGVTFKGSYDASTNTPDLVTPAPGVVVTGDLYVVSVAGTFFGEALEAGDSLISTADDPTTLAEWVRLDKNAGGAIPTLNQVLTAGNTSGAVNLLIDSARAGFGETSPSARVDIKGEDSLETGYSLEISNSSADRAILVINDQRTIFGIPGAGKLSESSVVIGESSFFPVTSTNDSFTLGLMNAVNGGEHRVHRISVLPPSTGFLSRDGGDLYVEAGSVTPTAIFNNEGGFLYLRSGRPSTDSGGNYGESKIFIQTGTTAGVSQRGTWATAITVNGAQNTGFGVDPSNDAVIEVKAGTATTAPIKLTAGTNLTTPVDGCLEFDGTNLYITIAGTRRTIQVV
jgi:hypothetical protein